MNTWGAAVKKVTENRNIERSSNDAWYTGMLHTAKATNNTCKVLLAGRGWGKSRVDGQTPQRLSGEKWVDSTGGDAEQLAYRLGKERRVKPGSEQEDGRENGTEIFSIKILPEAVS